MSMEKEYLDSKTILVSRSPYASRVLQYDASDVHLALTARRIPIELDSNEFYFSIHNMSPYSTV
jgi:hypothetical protein